MRHTDSPNVLAETNVHRLPDLSSSLVSRETQERLECYADLLQRWTRAINLVSERDRSVIWTRHIQDSLRMLPLVPPEADRAIDLGSGGGLPALPVSIVSGLPFDLVEADQRKATFLREAARITAAPVRVHCTRIEHADLAPAPVVTARALAPLSKLLGYAAPFLRPGGTGIFPKGANAASELHDARLHWRFSCRQYAIPDHASASILVVGDVQHV